MTNYVPLSVREGNWRAKARWQVSEARHRLALKIAPWVGRGYPTPHAYEQACKALWKHRAANEDLRAGLDRLMRERNAFHESLDWILHIELETPAETIAAMRDKARGSLERPR